MNRRAKSLALGVLLVALAAGVIVIARSTANEPVAGFVLGQAVAEGELETQTAAAFALEVDRRLSAHLRGRFAIDTDAESVTVFLTQRHPELADANAWRRQGEQLRNLERALTRFIAGERASAVYPDLDVGLGFDPESWEALTANAAGSTLEFVRGELAKSPEARARAAMLQLGNFYLQRRFREAVCGLPEIRPTLTADPIDTGVLERSCDVAYDAWIDALLGAEVAADERYADYRRHLKILARLAVDVPVADDVSAATSGTAR